MSEKNDNENDFTDTPIFANLTTTISKLADETDPDVQGEGLGKLFGTMMKDMKTMVANMDTEVKKATEQQMDTDTPNLEIEKVKEDITFKSAEKLVQAIFGTTTDADKELIKIAKIQYFINARLKEGLSLQEALTLTKEKFGIPTGHNLKCTISIGVDITFGEETDDIKINL